VPNISSFYGIVILMFHRHGQHKAPYFHAQYQGKDASFLIESGEMVSGELSVRTVRIVQEWAVRHRDELMDNWERAVKLEPLKQIVGADND
jgi:hypothetical protein